MGELLKQFDARPQVDPQLIMLMLYYFFRKR